MELLRELYGKTFPQYEKGKMVWKKASAHPRIQVWTQAVKAMRREIKVTGLVAAGGKTKSGKAIFVKARAILALTIISTLTPYAFVCDCRCAPCYFVLVGSKVNYNQCYPYVVNKFGKIKDCGAGPVVNV